MNKQKAFPKSKTHEPYQDGMDLRDYIAIHASDEDVTDMQKEIADELNEKTEWSDYLSYRDIPRTKARYRFADAMMEARK